MLHILAFNLLFRILAAQDNSQPQARQYQNIFDQPSLSPGHRDQAQIDPAAGQQWFYSSNRQPVAYSWYWSSNDQPSPSNFYKNTLPSDQAELLSAWACGRSQVANRFARIMGGQEAAPHSYPWMVSLAKRSLNNLHLCGGVLVTRRHILTAAHCIQDFKGVKDMNVFAGVHNINEKKNPVSPLTVDIHPQYEPETFANDVAVITLASPLPENDPRIGIVCLPPDDLSSKNYPPSKSSGVAIGWGSTSFGGRPSTALKQVVLPILPTERWPCNIYATHAQGQICAGDLAGGVDTCQADSGGPLMVENPDGRWEIVGITSFGKSCGKPNTPGIYTRVGTYNSFIRSTISLSRYSPFYASTPPCCSFDILILVALLIVSFLL